MVAMAVPAKRPSEVVNSDGRLTVMWDISSPCRDLAIYANLGSGVNFYAAGLSRGVFTHCIKMFGAPVHWLEMVRVEVVTVERMMRGLEHPRKGVVGKEPWEWTLTSAAASLPWGPWASSSATSEHWKGVTITQGDGGSLARTSLSVKVVNGSTHLLNSLMHSTSWCNSPGGGGLATLAQCCRALHTLKSFLVALNDNLVCRTLCPVVADGHYILGNVGQVAPCSQSAPWWCDSILWACGKMPISFSWTLGHLLSGGLLLALATRLESPPNGHATWSTPGCHKMMVQVSKNGQTHPCLHKVTWSWIEILGHMVPALGVS